MNAAENKAAAGAETPPKKYQPADESIVSSFCSHLIEACWLVAAGVLPLLMDPLAIHRFQPIKMSVLNSLGLISMAALAVCLVDGKLRRTASFPWWFAASLAILASLIASTAWSVAVPDSLWGAIPYLQGSFSLFCQLGLFAGVAICLRRKEQWDRLVVMILAASLPLALFVIYQRFGWDPSLFEAAARQTNSFAGHPAFAAGTLLLMIPLCGWKLFSSLANVRRTKGVRPLLAATFYSILIVIQISAILASGKRGPFLGLLAAAAAAAILHAVCGRRLRVAFGTIVMTGVAIVALTGLAFFARESPAIKELPVIKRLSMIVPVGEGSGDIYREMLWDKAPAITLGDEPKIFPSQETDTWWRIRPLVGYGPETLQAFFPQFIFLWGSGGPDGAIECRFHNSFWDRIQSVGILGLTALLGLQTLVFSRGLGGLGLHESAANPRLLALMGLLLGSGLGLALELQFGKGYFGLGFPLGFAGGLLLWPLAVVTRHPEPLPQLQSWKRPVGIAFLSALVAHWVDMAFLFPTANTSALSWVFAGALVALGRPDRNAKSSPAPLDDDAETVGWWRSGVLNGILAGCITAAVTHAFITYFFVDARTTSDVLESSLTRQLHDKTPSHLILLLLLPTYLTANLLLATMRPKASEESRTGKTLVVSGLISLTITAAWAVWKAGKLAVLGPLPQADTPLSQMLNQAAGLEHLALGFFLFIMMMLIPMAFALSRWQTSSGKKRVGVPALLVAIAGASLCVAAIRQTQVPILLHEASADYARTLDSMRLSAGAAELYRRASDHAPRDLNNRIQGTKALMAVAETSSDTDQYLRVVRNAEAFLEAGLKHGDRNVLNYYHGNVLMRQAFEMPAGAEREATARRAHAAFEAALIYAPNTEVAWFERSLVERVLLGDKAAADSSLARADEIAATVDPVVFGGQYSYQMQTTVNPVLNPAYGKRGVEYYTRALAGAAAMPAEKQSDLLVTKGTLLVNLRQPGEARTCLLEATKLGETTSRWRAHAMLTELFLKAGDRVSAAPHLDEAIQRAPEVPRRNLQELKARVFR